MKAKKLLSLILAGAAAVSLLAGCGSDTENTQAETSSNLSLQSRIQMRILTGQTTTVVSHGNMRTRA